MDVKTFAAELSRALAKRGIPRETAVKHAVSLVRTFDEEDLREITLYKTAEDFDDLSDSLAQLIKEKKPLKSNEDHNNFSTSQTKTMGGDTGEFPAVGNTGSAGESLAATREMPVINPDMPESPVAMNAQTQEIPAFAAHTREIPVVSAEKTSDGTENMKTRAFSLEDDTEELDAHTRSFAGIKTSDIPVKEQTASDVTMVNIPAAVTEDDQEQEIYLDDGEDIQEEKVTLTSRGKKFFVGISIAVSPLVFICALLVFGIFGLAIATVCAVMVAALLLVCAEAVAGCGLTLVGIIYGAIEIVSGNSGIGIYEIGLGICCGGFFIAAGVLTYNFTVLVMPYLLKQVISFEGFCLKRVGPMLNRFREECNRL